jgi:flagellar biosynthesis GTPase FlhF
MKSQHKVAKSAQSRKESHSTKSQSHSTKSQHKVTAQSHKVTAQSHSTKSQSHSTKSQHKVTAQSHKVTAQSHKESHKVTKSQSHSTKSQSHSTKSQVPPSFRPTKKVYTPVLRFCLRDGVRPAMDAVVVCYEIRGDSGSLCILGHRGRPEDATARVQRLLSMQVSCELAPFEPTSLKSEHVCDEIIRPSRREIARRN